MSDELACPECEDVGWVPDPDDPSIWWPCLTCTREDAS